MPSARFIQLLLVTLALAAATTAPLRGQVPGLSPEISDPRAAFTPRDRRLLGHLDQAQRELSDPQSDHRTALESLQQLIDQADDVFLDESMRQSVRQQALNLIATLPEPTARLYEETFGPDARALLNSDELTPEQARRQVVRRFFGTSAGADAAWQLAVAQMDRGGLLSAARLLERLHNRHPRAEKFEPQLTLRRIVCYWQSGEIDRAVETLRRAARDNPDLELLGRSLPPLTTAELAREWLAKSLGDVQPGDAVTARWLVPHGASTGNHNVDSVSPLYDNAWSTKLIGPRDIDSPVLTEELDSLLDGITAAVHEAADPAIPAVAPIVVGDLVVFASYGYVKAVAIDSGQLRWVALPADHSFADLLTTTAGAAARRLPEEMTDFVLQRGWLDRVSSQISSDTERVYALRDGGMIGGMGSPINQISRLDHPRQARPYNALRAYDAVGGSWLWELGGPRVRIASALAGTYFLGPPLEVDGTLYVLGEDLGQVRLHAVEPHTGEPLWSVPLANSDSDIEDDLDRRLSGLSPMHAGGLLICPTGSGMVVAVDPLTRALQWGRRYRDPPERNRRRQFRQGQFLGITGPHVPQMSVEDLLSSPRWHDAGILAVGSSVLVPTPDVTESDDSRRLICLDLLDGTVRWQRRQEETLYVGGVYDDTVLLIGARHAEGASLDSGKTVWTIPIEPPSGRGVRSGRLYHLPLAGGEIATLDLAQGRLLARSQLHSGGVLGNLIAVDGRMISQSPTEVRAFRPRGEVLEQIADELQQQPGSPTALAARGELRLHAGDLEAGLADLRQAVSASDDQRARRLLVTALLEGLRSDFAGWRAHVDELDELTAESPLRNRFLMTYAAGLIEAGETTDGFRQYLRLLRLVGPEAPLDYVDESRRVRRDRRILGELAQLYSDADLAGQEQLQAVIAEEVSAAAPQADESLLGQLAYAIPTVRGESVDDTRLPSADSDLSPAALEARLLSARRRSPDEQQAIIAARLVTLYARHGRAEPVISLLKELETTWAEQPCLDELTAAQWADKARQRESIAALLTDQPVWPTENVQVREGLGQENPFAPMRREGPFDPLVSPYLFLPNGHNQISIRDGFGRPIDEGVLSTMAGIPASFSAQYVMQRGHRALIFQGTQFKLIDLIDGTPRTVLEELVVDMQASEVRGLRINQRNVLQQQGFRGTALLSPDPGESGGVGPLNDSIFCYVRGTTLYAHDPFSGKALWSIEDVPHGVEIFADEHYVVLVQLGQNVAHLYRALDGKKSGVRTLPPDVVRERHGADWGRCFLRLSRGRETHRLAMYDPVTQEDLWQRDVPATFLWAPRNGYDLCVVDPAGSLTVLDPLSGEVLHELAIELPEGLQSIGVLNLPDQWLLATYRRPKADDVSQLAIRHGRTATIPVNGPVFAFQRQTGETMWSRVFPSQLIAPDLPSRWPILPLSATLTSAALADGGRVPVLTRRVVIVDLQSGQTVHEADSSAAGNLRSLDCFWQINESPPQLQLQYGPLELELTFGTDPAHEEAPPQPALPSREEEPPLPGPFRPAPKGDAPTPSRGDSPPPVPGAEDLPAPPPPPSPQPQ